MFRSKARKSRTKRACRGQPRPSCRLWVEQLEERALLSVVNWINPAGGDWATAANWSTGALPGVGDDVVIDVPKNITVTHSSGTDTVHSLTSQKILLLSGGSLGLATASKMNHRCSVTRG